MVTQQNIDRVLEFERLFNRPIDAWNFNRWGFSTDFQPFVNLLYEENFVIPFDWSTWSLKFGRDKLIAPAVFHEAEIDQVQRLITSAIRMDRHSDLLHKRLVQGGWFTAFFHQIRALRDSAPVAPPQLIEPAEDEATDPSM